MERYLLTLLLAIALIPTTSQAQIAEACGAACGDACIQTCGPMMLDVIASMEEKGLEIRLTQIDDYTLPVFGFKGGWFLDDNIIMGWAGYGTLFTSNSLTEEAGGYGYAGIYFDVRHNTYNPVHLSTSMFLGYGGAAGFDISGRKDFWIAEPTATAIFSLSDQFKIGFGGSYRAYIASPGISRVDQTRFSLNFSLLFYTL